MQPLPVREATPPATITPAIDEHERACYCIPMHKHRRSRRYPAAPQPAATSTLFHIRSKSVPNVPIRVSETLQIGPMRPEAPDMKWNKMEQNGTLFRREGPNSALNSRLDALVSVC